MKRLVPLALVLLAGCGDWQAAERATLAERCRARGGIFAQVVRPGLAHSWQEWVCMRPDTISLAIPGGEK